MSGTSADAIDAALVDFSDTRPTLVDFISHPIDYQAELKLLNQDGLIHLNQLSQLHRKIGEQFAAALTTLRTQAGLTTDQVAAIGSHGQTIFHAPELGMSLQIGHPAVIAKHTGLVTVGDFRIDDMALSGQGAPLAPAFHRTLIDDQQTACFINIGGISNISVIKPDGETLGYDTGPGNGLMDEICQQYFNQAYDPNGEIAAAGKVNQAWLAQLLKHHYFKRPAPKSTGRETFNQAWLDSQIDRQLDSAENLISTLNQFTVESLAQAIEQHQLPDKTACYICGGGALNLTILHRLQNRLPNLHIQSIQQLGFDPNAIEAMMCAWLAKQRLENIPVDLTNITGSSRPAILGGIWQP